MNTRVLLSLSPDEARDLKLLLLAGNYHKHPRALATFADRLDYAIATKCIKQIDTEILRIEKGRG